MSGSIEAFYQEAGRADRGGKPACCELLFILVILRLRFYLTFVDIKNP